MIARAGMPIFQAAYGYADRNKNVRNSTDTQFRFGSMGKMFTAVAVLQLVQAGKVGLEDPISKFLPDYPNKEVSAVTIHQLLTHTAGTGDIFGPEFAMHRAELKELGDYAALYGNRGLRFQPGSRHEYSNYGFVLLGRVIEVASGQRYHDYVREYIFKPAGMISTDNLPEAQRVENLAVGYTREDASVRPGPGRVGPTPPAGALYAADAFLPYRGTSAGGGYSTVGDMLNFANALDAFRLLNSEFTSLATAGKVETPRSGMKYAYGFEDSTGANGVRRIGHGGGAPGMNAVLWIFPSAQYVIIVLANLDPPAAQAIARFAADRLPVR
jgi:CubicO group peptidase (beta-lactamase class C family)